MKPILLLRRVTRPVLLLGLFAPASLARAQGSLAPPGAPAPIMRSLQQIEPRTVISSIPFSINQSGSYVLAANLTGASGQNGISIWASNVTLDLGGFELRGVTGSWHGVFINNNLQDIVVHNGQANGWGRGGVYGANVRGSRVENVLARGNGGSHPSIEGAGIRLGHEAVVRNCQALANVSFGIRVGDRSRVEDSQAHNQTIGSGISVGGNSSVIGCNVSGNFEWGLFGNDGVLVQSCVLANNNFGGIRLGNDAMVLDTVSRDSQAYGLELGHRSILRNLTVSGNGAKGILAGESAIVQSCTAVNNHEANIEVGTHSQVKDCLVKGGNGLGISALDNAIITGNSVNSVGTHGIEFRHRCLVTRNQTDFTMGGAGLRVTGESSRIAENNVSRANIGLQATHPGNFILHNSFTRCNASLNVVDANSVARLIVVPLTAPINGNSGNSIGFGGVEDPWLNFTILPNAP